MRVRTVVKVSVVLAVALVVTGIALVAAIDREALRDRIEQRLSQAFGRPVTIAGPVEINHGLHPVIVMHDARLANIEGGRRDVMAEFGRVDFEVALWPLIRGQTRVESITLRDGVIFLERAPDGTPNWRFRDREGDGGGTFAELTSLTFRDTDLTYAGTLDQARTLNAVVASLSGPEPTAPATLTFEGTLEGMGAKLEGSVGSMRAFVENRPDFPIDLSLLLGDSRIEADGTLGRVFGLETFRFALEYDGDSMAPAATLLGTALPDWSPASFGGTLSRSSGEFRFTNATGTLGSTKLAGDITLDRRGEVPFLGGSLRSDELVLADLLAGGVLAERQEAAPGQTGKAIVPAVPLDLTVLTLFDAEFALRADRLLIGPDALEGVVAAVAVRDGRATMQLEDAALWGGVLGGSVVADGAADPPLVGADIAFLSLNLGDLLAARGITDRFEGAADFALRAEGAGGDLAAVLAALDGEMELIVGEGRIDSKTLQRLGESMITALMPSAEDDGPVPLRCAVVRTPIRDGVAQTDDILIALPDVTIGGQGAVDLESMTLEMVLKPRSTNTEILAVDPTVRVYGPILDPEVAVDSSEMIARGAASVLLGLLNPLAIVVPLVSAGEGDENPCAAALAEGVQ